MRQTLLTAPGRTPTASSCPPDAAEKVVTTYRERAAARRRRLVQTAPAAPTSTDERVAS